MDVGQKQGGDAGLGQFSNAEKWNSGNNVSHRPQQPEKTVQD